jgi:hypothetical protein
VSFLATLPSPGASSLARDGVVLFALLHRSLADGSQALGQAQLRPASANALSHENEPWKPAEAGANPGVASDQLALRAGVLHSAQKLLALNRPPGEDALDYLAPEAIQELFTGLDFRILTDSLEEKGDLTREVWRTFLLAMAVALLGEALLCLPPARNPTPAGAASRRESLSGGFPSSPNPSSLR